MYVRPWIGLAIALTALLGTTPAQATWHEAHQAGDEGHIRVDSRGMATVEHLLKWRVVHGPLASVDLNDVDPHAVLEPTAAVRTEDGRDLTAHVVRGDDSVVRVLLDSPKALTHGIATIDVKWQVDLVATRAIVADGPRWRLSWSMPAALSGFDLPRMTVDLPAAPEAPRSVGIDPDSPDEGAGETVTLRREGERDLLEIVRPYAAHGESIAGAVRFDPRALPDVVDPILRPSRATIPSPEEPPWRQSLKLGLLGVVAVAFGLLVASRDRAFVAACAIEKSSAVGLVPLARVPRAVLGGLALGGAMGLQVIGQEVAGGLLVAIAILCAALRAPELRPVARGPGRWFPLRPQDAFGRNRGGSSRANVPWWATMGAVAVVAVIAWAASRLSLEAPWLVWMDSAPIVPLLLTGRRSQHPVVDLETAGQLLRRAFVSLKATAGLRVVPWARVGLSGSIDELRIRALPEMAVPGVIGIEMGHAWSRTPVGWASAPEVLIRVLDGSAAAAKLVKAMPDARPLHGRRAQERVVRLAPPMPTRAACLALVRRAATLLTDRRVASDAPRNASPERRKDFPAPPARRKSQAPRPSAADATC
jgi:hypothetical protein